MKIASNTGVVLDGNLPPAKSLSLVALNFYLHFSKCV